MNRVTLRKTLISCALLGGALLLAIVSMSLLGSERLPARASLCALASLGTRACGLTSDQFDILFQIRLPRILLAAAVGGSLATAGAGYQALLRNPLERWMGLFFDREIGADYEKGLARLKVLAEQP